MRLVAGTGVLVSTFLGLSPTAEAVPSGSPAQGSYAGYTFDAPASPGKLVVTQTVPIFTCVPGYGMETEVAFAGYWAGVLYVCDGANGTTEDVDAFYNSRPSFGMAMKISPGDVIEIEFTPETGSQSGTTRIDVIDLSIPGTQDMWTTTPTVSSPTVSIEMVNYRESPDVPPFGVVHFTGAKWGGVPLGQLQGLISSNLLDQKGRVQVRTSALSTSGTRFSLRFARST